MLPRATERRTPREAVRLSGRTQEIRRLIGRALRASVNLASLGERTIIIDCDVIQADGGTRAASITGGMVALTFALRRLIGDGLVDVSVIGSPVAAVSAGWVGSQAMLDLCYAEDSRAEADFNVVMNDAGEFVEVQGAAEGHPFSRARLSELLDLAEGGILQLLSHQRRVLGG